MCNTARRNSCILPVWAQPKWMESKAKVLKATSEIAADLYLELAAIDAVLPGGVTKVSAPDVVIYDRGASEDARAETRVRLAQEAYANYRAQGGLK